MATVPLSGTNIRLLSGVPFSNDYKHSRWFDTLTQQTTYFTGKTVVHSMTQANFQRIEGKNFVSVNESIDSLWGTNYIMFQNAQYNNKWFYAFVTKLEYVQRNTTYVHFEIDVFQTWKFEMNFKPSYVVREHCKLWNSDGTPVINTIDEGLDYGAEYDIKGAGSYNPTPLLFLVIVAKATLHVADGDPDSNYIKASMNGGPQPLSIYLHPFDPFGGTPPIVVDGVLAELSTLKEILNQIYSLEGAVNNIVSLYITDHAGINFPIVDDEFVADTSFFQTLIPVNIDGSTLTTLYVDEAISYSSTTIETRRKYIDFGAIYSGGNVSFPDIKESKLLMYPYSFSILDDFKGNRVVIKNEYVDGDKIEIAAFGSMGVSNKVTYNPSNYLTSELVSSIDRDMMSMETGIIDNTPHDVSIITDMLSAYIQGNKNSIQNQADMITFNGITDIASGAIGGIGSALMRNPIGVASSGLGMVKGGGNAVLQLQGIQAKVKDINNLPPQLSKMGSNTAYDYGNGYYGVWMITKMIKPEYQKKLTDFWNMYGYKVNEVKMPNFHTRARWNFVQTNSCMILGDFNNEDLQELKSIFDNGITLWHIDDVGNYSLSNGVI